MWNLHKSSVTVLALLSGVLGTDILSTNGFSDCSNNSTITVSNLNLQFDRSTNLLTFDVSGTSSKSQAVTATLTVTAYGVQVYQKSFDPCDAATKVDQLCPCKLSLLFHGSIQQLTFLQCLLVHSRQQVHRPSRAATLAKFPPLLTPYLISTGTPKWN
jgi:ML-like domain